MRLYYKTLSILVCSVLFLICVYSLVIELQRNYSDGSSFQKEQLSLHKNEDYNVWCIFTKVRTHKIIKDRFNRMLFSLLNTTSSVITLNLITDSSSRIIAKDIILNLKNSTGKDLKVSFHDVNVITNKIGNVVYLMRKYFSSQPGAYYSDPLFFVSLVLHKIAVDQHKVILIDVDTVIKVDIIELFNEFSKFSNESMIGIAPELSPVYHHILYRYRQQHKSTKLGIASSEGGFPGVNSGVLALDLDRLRSSQLFQELLMEKSLDRLTKKYFFKGHLGDQDFYTLIGLEHLELLHLLDCGWNRQLCTWWSKHGYSETFHKFFTCPSPIKIYHGNCNTDIPS
ncbi:xyloside xylosyltransferase 1 [Halyomorpha halys]|uniref:xyloside xylosyltransferase 1 n=1 Tax=Halyomorpha halys TaxID=286706 RepID=UPI0006D522B8|nr:xyloside xylosyltransferase 1 [Halyomorpha halys]